MALLRSLSVRKKLKVVCVKSLHGLFTNAARQFLLTLDVEGGIGSGDRRFYSLHKQLLHSLSAPTDAQVACVLVAISTLPKPVFVHCQYGCDRTGTIIACYRVQQDHWTNSSALTEAEVYGISPFEVGMRNYIRHFKK